MPLTVSKNRFTYPIKRLVTLLIGNVSRLLMQDFCCMQTYHKTGIEKAFLLNVQGPSGAGMLVCLQYFSNPPCCTVCFPTLLYRINDRCVVCEFLMKYRCVVCEFIMKYRLVSPFLVYVVAGKTTLLDVLAQRKKGTGVSGSIKLNGGAIDSHFQLASAYVTQDDVFVAQLSALETLQFYAALTVPARVSAKDRQDRILAVLATLGLSHTKNTKV
jgi:hypothetical protein